MSRKGMGASGRLAGFPSEWPPVESGEICTDQRDLPHTDGQRPPYMAYGIIQESRRFSSPHAIGGRRHVVHTRPVGWFWKLPVRQLPQAPFSLKTAKKSSSNRQTFSDKARLCGPATTR